MTEGELKEMESLAEQVFWDIKVSNPLAFPPL